MITLYNYLFLNKTEIALEVDSLQVPYSVEKRLTRWESAKIELGGLAFGFIVAFILTLGVWLVYKKIRK